MELEEGEISVTRSGLNRLRASGDDATSTVFFLRLNFAWREMSTAHNLEYAGRVIIFGQRCIICSIQSSTLAEHQEYPSGRELPEALPRERNIDYVYAGMAVHLLLQVSLC